MSTYQHVLPQVFPFSVAVPLRQAREAAELLLERPDLMNGSSFAVTARTGGMIGYAGDDARGLWLSAASARFLAMSGRASDALNLAVHDAIDQQAV